MDLIVAYYSDNDTEIVVFGDEKQNIYERELDENREIKTTGIIGRWNRSLKKSFRFKHAIGKLAIDFQKEFLSNKYGLDEILINQQDFNFEPSIIEYYELNDFKKIKHTIFKFIDEYDLHSNDVVILGDKIGVLRELDFEIRHKYQEDTITTFETQEEYKKLEEKGLLIKDNIDEIRRAKKIGFWLNAGMIKLSTVHSFKGWEIYTLFLLIDAKSTLELVYTGITRARQNIVIINLGNPKFTNFFGKFIK